MSKSGFGSGCGLVGGGNYTLEIGNSSKDIKLKDTVSLKENLTAETVNKAMAPEKEMKILSK